MDGEQPLEPDVMLVLRTAGYVGAHTVGAPKDNLKDRLSAIRDAGQALAGTGGFAPPPPGLAGPFPPAPQPAAGGLDTNRWASGLPADLQRGAPEIYRNMRAEGVGNIREWLNMRYAGTKSNSNLGQGRAKSGTGLNSAKARAVQLKRKDSARSSKNSKREIANNNAPATATAAGTSSAGFKNLNFKGSKGVVGKVSVADVTRRGQNSYINMNKNDKSEVFTQRDAK